MEGDMDPIEASLQRSLSILSNDFVHAFLFPRDPSTHLSQLNYALAHPNSVTGNLSLKSLAPLQTTVTPYSFEEHLRFLLLPSFTAGAVTLGFYIFERHDTPGVLGGVRRYSARFVRDDDNGLIMYVAHHKQLGLTELMFCSKVAPSLRDHVFLLYRTPEFQKAMATFPPDHHILRKALVYSYYSIEMRPCLKCGRPTSTCTCSLAMTRKNHTLDDVTELINLASYSGAHEGVAEMRIYSDARVTYRGFFVSRADAELAMDSDGRSTLSKWAMCVAAGDRTVNLTRLTMPNASGAETGERQYGMGAQNIVRPEMHDMTSNTAVSGLETAPQRTSVLAEPQNVMSAGDYDAAAAALEMFLSDATTEVPPHSPDPASPLQGQEPVPPEVAALAQVLPDPRQAVRRLPRLEPKRDVSSDGKDANTAKPYVTERELMLAARKARNRESAFRSNQKKKILVEKLREDLVAAEIRRDELVEKEKTLREENEMLKEQFFGS